jgi:hypothetical protein
MVYDSSPKHIVKVAFLILSYSIKAYVELKVGIQGDGILTCICCEAKAQILEEKCHTSRSRCASVWSMVD